MEEEGIVSIWLGNFSDENALITYAAEEGRINGAEVVSQFSKDFFNGEMWAFDPDFFERAVVKPSNNISKLVKPFSYGETFEVDNIKLNKSYNAVILVYDYKYEVQNKPVNAPVEFIAAVPYENLDL